MEEVIEEISEPIPEPVEAYTPPTPLQLTIPRMWKR
jgi:hypothetical protein